MTCITCIYPETKPDLYFENGECSACRSFKHRPNINWVQRKDELFQLLDRFHGECIVPSSGGKDSTYQVIKLLELGADPLVVTATTCHLTPIGRRNIENLSRYARTIEITPNASVRAKLNRFGLELVGDISWPEHASIFSVPFQAAVAFDRPLIFYGENPQNQYGGPMGSEEAKQMTQRWTQEYGGFLGLRPSDFVGMEGIQERHMRSYEFPKDIGKTEAHFLGQYLPWDSHENAKIAREHGMIQQLPTPANWWDFENLDNAQTGLHDYMMWRKYGYGRATAQLSVDIRNGLIDRDFALSYAEEHEHIFPEVYAGVRIEEVLDNINMTREELDKIIDQYTNWGIHAGTPNHSNCAK